MKNLLAAITGILCMIFALINKLSIPMLFIMVALKIWYEPYNFNWPFTIIVPIATYGVSWLFGVMSGIATKVFMEI